MVELASILAFLVALYVSTMVIYVVTRLLGAKEEFGRTLLATLIIWQRTSSHNGPDSFGSITDCILCYDKSDESTWHKPYSLRG